MPLIIYLYKEEHWKFLQALLLAVLYTLGNQHVSGFFLEYQKLLLSE